MSTPATELNPTTKAERIHALDVLRGFAVLGILLMNIQSFSMIQAAYINPSAYGDLTGVNRWVWIIVHIVADQKFMTIFSMLFGAGIILFTSRAAAKNLKPAPLYYRRILWLFVAGMIHAYLLWYGDILVTYALCGVLAYWVRKWKVRGLITLGAILLAVPAFNYWLFGMSMSQWPEEAVASLAAEWNPPPSEVQKELEAMRGSYFDQMQVRVPAAFGMQTFLFLIWYGWRALGLMMIGMALYKARVFTAERSGAFYWVGMLLGFTIGLPLVIEGVKNNFAASWSLQYSMFLGWEWNYIGSLFVAFGYVCKIMLLAKYGVFAGVLNVMSRVGRMAFTGYILMTLLCTFIFYGHGLGYYGKLDRLEQMGVVVVVWIVVIVFARYWMARYRYGPLEWLWRKLTYGRHMMVSIRRDPHD